VKRYFVPLMLVVLITSLAACGPQGAPTAPPPTSAQGQPTSAPAAATATTAPQQPTTAPTAATTGAPGVVLQFWHGQSQSQQTALNSIIDQFNSSHPGITVVPTYQGNYSDLFNKVTAAIAAGTPPDLAIAYQDDVANYLKSDAVVPLDSLMSDPQIGFSTADLQDIYPTFIDHYPLYNNQVYSIAFMRSMEVMYYDADMLKAAGFDQPPSTWDQFLQICTAVSKPPDTYCYELNPDASTFAHWVWSRGGTLLSPDAKSVTFDSAAGLDSLTLIQQLFQSNQAILIAKAFQDQTDFALGKVAFTFGSTAGLPFYAQAIQQSGKVTNWAISPGPHTTPDPVVDLYGPSVTIFKTTTEKERAAFVFLKWMMDPAPNAQWCEATQYFPARKSTQSSMTSFIQSNPLYGDALGWVQYGQTEPALAAWTPIRTDIQDAMTAVADGQQTAQAAMSDLVQKSNTVLAQQ
jgi:multiple sugar transport system substrate-binding protein